MAATSHVVATAVLGRTDATERLHAAACRLYDAEVALHIAHQTQIDAWIEAAARRLHAAVLEHCAAERALGAADGPVAAAG